MFTHSIYRQKRFIRHLNQIFETHLSDPDLTIAKLTRLLGMSRTDLHRKLSRTMGMSATEYLRYKRLQLAAILLIEFKDWSIGRVAFEVGFNSQSYFNKRFREAFGMCPRYYRQKYLTGLDTSISC